MTPVAAGHPLAPAAAAGAPAPQHTRLALLATALGLQGLALVAQAGTSRWRGLPGAAERLALAPTGAPHRHQRLQLLRHVLDRQPGGRWATAVADNAASAIGAAPLPALVRRLFLWLDGRRVDAQLAQRFPGAAADLALDPAPRLPDTWLACQPPGAAADAAQALQQAWDWHTRLRADRPARRNGHGRAAAARPARLLQVQPAAGPGSSDGMAPGGEGLAGDGGGSADHPGSGPAGRPSARPPGHSSGSATSGDGVDGAALPGGDNAAADAAPASRRTRLPDSPATAASGARTTLHDEWDCHLQAHRRHWTAVHEHRLQGTDLHFLDGLRARFPTLVRQLQRHAVRLRADLPQRTRRLADGDTVDLDAALDALVARRTPPQAAVGPTRQAGGGPRPPWGDDRLYAARPLRERALAVALLLDTSSSTGYPIPSPADTAAPEPLLDDLLWLPAGKRWQPAAPRRRVLDVVRDAAGLLCEALHRLGDRQAVFGFSGQGRLQVDLAVVKDFDDPWGPAQGAALAALQPQGATRTGAAVRHAVHRLQDQPARRRLLVVLSDGYPQDQDYGSGPDALHYGLQDTAQALREAERAGVACLQVSVDAAAHDYLRRVCPKHRYWVVDTVEALPARMLALARLLAGRR